MSKNPQFGTDEIAANQAQPEVVINAVDRAISAALAGQITINVSSDANLTLSSSQWVYGAIRITDTGNLLSATRDVVYPDVDTQTGGTSRHKFLFVNATTRSLVVKRSGQTGVTVSAGTMAYLWHNGTDIEQISAGGGGTLTVLNSGSPGATVPNVDVIEFLGGAVVIQDPSDATKALVDLSGVGGGGGGGSIAVSNVGSPGASLTGITKLRFTSGAVVSLNEADPTQADVAVQSSGGGAATDDAYIWRTKWFANVDSSSPVGFGFNSVTQSGIGSVFTPTGATKLDSYYAQTREPTAAVDQSAEYRFVDGSASVYRATTGGGPGFEWRFLTGLATTKTDMRMFFGLTAATGAPTATADPSTFVNCLGFGKDQADTNLQFMHNDGSGTCTKVNLGVSPATLAGRLLDMRIKAAVDGTVTYDLWDIDTNTHYAGSVSTDLPAVDTRLYARAWVNTGSATSTAPVYRFIQMMMRWPEPV